MLEHGIYDTKVINQWLDEIFSYKVVPEQTENFPIDIAEMMLILDRKKWSDVLGMNLSSLRDLILLLDHLISYANHNLDSKNLSIYKTHLCSTIDLLTCKKFYKSFLISSKRFSSKSLQAHFRLNAADGLQLLAALGKYFEEKGLEEPVRNAHRDIIALIRNRQGF